MTEGKRCLYVHVCVGAWLGGYVSECERDRRREVMGLDPDRMVCGCRPAEKTNGGRDETCSRGSGCLAKPPYTYTHAHTMWLLCCLSDTLKTTMPAETCKHTPSPHTHTHIYTYDTGVLLWNLWLSGLYCSSPKWSVRWFQNKIGGLRISNKFIIDVNKLGQWMSWNFEIAHLSGHRFVLKGRLP